MQVLDIYIQHPDGTIECRTSFSAVELQQLLQFAVNLSGSVGLSAYKKAIREQAESAFKKDPGEEQ